jgi:phosphate/sulfate permease
MPILPGNAGDLPLLGFGLWRVPIVAIPLEAALLLLGVFLYWRVAKSVGSRRGSRVTPALVTGALLASGGIVLLLDGLGF